MILQLDSLLAVPTRQNLPLPLSLQLPVQLRKENGILMMKVPKIHVVISNVNLLLCIFQYSYLTITKVIAFTKPEKLFGVDKVLNRQ